MLKVRLFSYESIEAAAILDIKLALPNACFMSHSKT